MTPIPSSTSASSPWGRVPWAFLASLVLFVGCEHWLWNYRPFLESLVRRGGRATGDLASTTARIRLLRSDTARPPIVLLGSSQIRLGLDCDVIERHLPGRKCENLAVNGGSPLDMLYLLDEVSERAPRHVTVLGVFPRILQLGARESFTNLDTLRCLFGSGAWRGQRASDWRRVLDGEVENVSETLRNKDSLVALFFPQPPPPPEVAPAAVLPAPVAPKKPEPLPDLEGRPDEQEPMARLRPSNEAQSYALDLMIRREAARHNLILVLNFPRREGYELYVSLPAKVWYRNLMVSLRGRSDVVFVPPKEFPLADSDFVDVVHLNEAGRAKASLRLAEIIQGLEGS